MNLTRPPLIEYDWINTNIALLAVVLIDRLFYTFINLLQNKNMTYWMVRLVGAAKTLVAWYFIGMSDLSCSYF